MSTSYAEKRTSVFSGIKRYNGVGVIIIVYAILGLTVVYPLFVMLLRAFTENDQGIGFDKIVEVMFRPEVLDAFKITMITCISAVVIATVTGVSLAWFVARTNMPGKRLFDALNMLPFYLSNVVGALAWQAIASPRTGLLNKLFEPLIGGPILDIYSMEGMIIVFGLFYTPYVYLFTLGSLQSMDPSLEDAARINGAGVLQTAIRITLPLSAPAILSASILVFVTSAGAFGVPLLLGGPGGDKTLSTLIFTYVSSYPADFAGGTILSTFLFIFTAGLTLLQIKLLMGRKFTTITGKGYRPKLIDLGRYKWVAFGFNSLYLFLVIGPFCVLALISIQDAWVGSFQFDRITFEHFYEVVFVDEVARRGLTNSLTIALVGATIAVLFCFSLAVIIHRTNLPGRFGIVALSMLPLTVPGIVLGIGYLIVALKTPLYGTLAIMVIAYVAHFLPTGLRNIESIVISMSKELDECARVCGASWWKAMQKIILPLCIPGMISTWILLFVIFIREVSSSIMLYVHGTETMSVALIRMMESRPLGVSAAFSIVQTVLLLVCAFSVRLLPTSRRD
ncbi:MULTISPECIES: ABC transporter permease [Pacificibacter]|uniref:ABC transporter permease n=1 Tax=Pacificibacter TaxID=1042323 RepID=UPI001C08E93F|nr:MULTISPECIES: iron ABC transporter permease [Pacificibacter]MBU2934548.1 iron ABC transporter permease [Pacificibacter marinus]MDO6617330.1 iron ABC transporter permease [Pacificibacter sp. 1_MG-2023]